ncbi:hypothetical protein IFM89_009934 [Coptis chinensis]|uniref:Uncharacterized protein n=1 Tax=Coptis chinensis TaxID=261450 RepID=A0A835HH12_9MAGN|nr:hypothetical protein IFM89_009934 [Coptis chinensis]
MGFIIGREYGLAHKTVVFVLDEFDLLLGKQLLLYSLLDAMQSVTSQAVVIEFTEKLGFYAMQDADQLLEKRVRSRFSHRKAIVSSSLKGRYAEASSLTL